MQIRLGQVADEGLLKTVWKKEVRPALRSMTFGNINLAPDPLHYAGYEWGLETLVAALARDLRLGRYAPERGEIVRSAKAKGLSRPLCFLATRDALVYSAITWLARAELMTDAQVWVGVAHSDKGSPGAKIDDEAGDSFDWFRFWLARQGHILQMVDDDTVNFFVESDIANFYPSIRLEAIREHLHSRTSLEKEVVRLCVQIIDGVMPRRDYSEVSLMGLPQEQIGSSRDIAHSLLLHVDKAFEVEGAQGHYTRFMDDILVGVKTPQDGFACISRLQRSLEALGLYPNAAKTTVTTVGDYLTESMVATNAAIDRVGHELEKHSQGIPHVITAPPELIADLEKLSREHREAEPQPKRWNRVTRRIYTLHRKADVRDWWAYWRDDIAADPGSAKSILEFVRSWPLNLRTAADLTNLSVAYGDLYADVSLLAAETMVSAPVGRDEALWSAIFDICKNELGRLVLDAPRIPERERLAAAWLLAAWKFANEAQRRNVLSKIPSESDAVSAVRVQALPLLVAAGQSLSEWVSAKPGLAWENALAAEYLRSLQDGEDRAVGVALNLLNPELRLAPQRYVILPRALPLIDIVGRSASTRLGDAAPRVLAKLQKNPERLRDYRAEAIISRWCL
ncbi:RNA-directed DNA polymerase [Micromonospora sediminimaris]|uniref:RNA-directed DNA polymerase n=1 Tax=Micromonospora sediminimaris TaxID=547162 RepID=UPI00379E013C